MGKAESPELASWTPNYDWNVDGLSRIRLEDEDFPQTFPLDEDETQVLENVPGPPGSTGD